MISRDKNLWPKDECNISMLLGRAIITNFLPPSLSQHGISGVCFSPYLQPPLFYCKQGRLDFEKGAKSANAHQGSKKAFTPLASRSFDQGLFKPKLSILLLLPTYLASKVHAAHVARVRCIAPASLNAYWLTFFSISLSFPPLIFPAAIHRVTHENISFWFKTTLKTVKIREFQDALPKGSFLLRFKGPVFCVGRWPSTREENRHLTGKTHESPRFAAGGKDPSFPSSLKRRIFLVRAPA